MNDEADAFQSRLHELRERHSRKDTLLRGIWHVVVIKDAKDGVEAEFIYPSSFLCACGYRCEFSENTLKVTVR